MIHYIVYKAALKNGDLSSGGGGGQVGQGGQRQGQGGKKFRGGKGKGNAARVK